MTKRSEYTGMRFGWLTVNEYVGSDSYGNARWDCTCACGNHTVVTSTALRSGRTRSCGCLRGAKYLYEGLRFGSWTVIEEKAPKDPKVLCQCDCGTVRKVYLSNLKRGTSTSCGCTSRIKE